jgi:hypothetical protein
MGIRDLLFNLSFSFNATDAMREAGKFDTKIGQILMDTKDVVQNLSNMGKGMGIDHITEKIVTADEAFQSASESLSQLQSKNLGDLFGQWNKIDADVSIYNGKLEELARKYANIADKQKGIDFSTAFFVGQLEAKKFSDAVLKSADSTRQLFETFGDNKIIETLGEPFRETMFSNEKLAKSLGATMENARDLQKSISNPKILAQYKQRLDDFSRAADGSAEAIKELEKDIRKLNKTAEMSGKILPGIAKQFKDIGSQILYPIMQVLSLSRAMMDSISAQDQMATTLHELSLSTEYMADKTALGITKFDGFFKTLTDYNDKVRAIGASTQVSLTEVTEAFTALANTRVSRNQEDLLMMTEVVVQMGQAFGSANGEAANLINTLVKVGGVKPKDIRAIANEMAKVQKVYGLTGQEAQEVASSTAKVMNRMSSMTAGAVKNARAITSEVAKMTVAFTRAGLSANEASAFIDRMMNPDEIENNIYLWSRMGISAADALDMMSGNGDQMIGMTEKLGKAAYDLMEQYQHPMVLNELSKAMGMNLGMVKQLADGYKEMLTLSPELRAEMQKEKDLEDQAARSRLSLQKSLGRIAATLNILISGFVEPLIDFLSPTFYLIAELGKGIGKLTVQLEKWGGAGKAVQMFLSALVISMILFKGHAFGLFQLLLGGLGNLLKIVPIVGKLVGGFFTGLGDKIFFATEKSKLLEKIGAGLSNFGRRLKGETVTTGANKGVGKATEAIAKNAKQADKGAGAMERISRIPAKNIALLGVALLALAAAVFVLVKAFGSLVAIIDKHKDQPKILIASAAAIIILTTALIFATKLLAWAGKNAKNATKDIAALGAAMLLLAAAVWILVQAMKIISNIFAKGMNAWKSLGVIAVLIGVLTGALVILAKFAKSETKTLLMLGVAMLMLSGSVWILAQAMEKITAIFTNFNNAIAAGVTIVAFILTLAVAMFIIGQVGQASALGLLAASVAMIAMSAAIYGIAMAMKIMSEATAGLDAMISVMWGLAGLLAVIGMVGASANVGLLIAAAAVLALGAALLMVGFGVKLASEGISLLTKTIDDMASGFLKKGSLLALVMLEIGVASIVMGVLGLIGCIGIAALAAAIYDLSRSGKGVKDLADGLKYIAESTADIKKGLGELKTNMGEFDGIAKPFADAIGNLATPLTALSAYAYATNESIRDLSITMNSLAGAGVGIKNLADGLKYMAENSELIETGLGRLKTNMEGLDGVAAPFAKAVKDLSVPLNTLAQDAWGANANISILMGSLASMATYTEKTEKSLTKISELFTSMPTVAGALITALNSIPDSLKEFAEKFKITAANIKTGIGDLSLSKDLIKSFGTLGDKTTKAANNFERMGIGIKMFVENISLATAGIDLLSEKLNGIAGLSEKFVQEISKISGAVEGLNEIMLPGAIQVSQTVQQNNNNDTSVLVARFDDVISRLDLIQTNTKNTADNTKKIVERLGKVGSGNKSSYMPLPEGII